MSARLGLPRGWWLLVIAFPFVTLFIAISAVLISGQGGFAALRVPKHGDITLFCEEDVLAHGEYLARLGNCTTCHTVRGGAPLAGGKPFTTPWGTLYSSNITKDPEAGIGDWSEDEFRHAMKHGVSRHGALYPAFPFQNFQHLSDYDLNAIFAWLRSQPAVATPPPENRLESLAGWRPSVFGWRMLFHRPSPLPEVPERDADWQRGRYLVEGLGHCSMCHGQRGAWGSMEPMLRHAGGVIPGQGWSAPALDRNALARWNVPDLADYLRTGVGPQASAYGPMAEVIQSSLQHLTSDDARAMATYLLDLPPVPQMARRRPAYPVERASQFVGITSSTLYETHCGECHGTDGQGRTHVYPPLAGNPHVMATDPVNLIRVTLFGAAAPTTAGNPAPHSMPPFAGRLSDEDLIIILNHVRGSWGNEATAVTARQLQAVRGLPLQ